MHVEDFGPETQYFTTAAPVVRSRAAAATAISTRHSRLVLRDDTARPFSPMKKITKKKHQVGIPLQPQRSSNNSKTSNSSSNNNSRPHHTGQNLREVRVDRAGLMNTDFRLTFSTESTDSQLASC